MSAFDYARADAKDALARELMLRSQGIVSVSKFNSDLATFLAQYGPATFAAQGMLPSTLSPPANYSRSVNQYPETNPSGYCQAGYSCYCGPAAAVSVLHYLQNQSHDGEYAIDSNGDWHNGEFGPAGNFWSQQAPNPPYSWKYLETNVSHRSIPGGETPWYSGNGDYPMPQSFNYWISGSYSGFPGYVPHRPTSASDYESDLVADIWSGGPANSSGNPLAGDVEEIAGAQYVHLPGHPSSLEVQHRSPCTGTRAMAPERITSIQSSAVL